jgi:hypothetical protein
MQSLKTGKFRLHALFCRNRKALTGKNERFNAYLISNFLPTNGACAGIKDNVFTAQSQGRID